MIARRFIVGHDAGDTSCAAEIPPLPRVAAFPRTVTDALPATGLTPGASHHDRQIVSVAVDTVSDALARLRELYLDVGYGLRGGHFRTNGDDTRVRLDEVRWTDDLAVSGTVEATDDPQIGQGAAVEVDVRLDDGTTGHLRWTFADLGDPVTVTGEIAGRPISVVARTA